MKGKVGKHAPTYRRITIVAPSGREIVVARASDEDPVRLELDGWICANEDEETCGRFHPRDLSGPYTVWHTSPKMSAQFYLSRGEMIATVKQKLWERIEPLIPERLVREHVGRAIAEALPSDLFRYVEP